MDIAIFGKYRIVIVSYRNWNPDIDPSLWRILCRAKIPSSKEPLGLTRSDGKRHAHPLVKQEMLDMGCHCARHNGSITRRMADEAADKAVSNKKTNYSAFQQTHRCVPVSFETMGSWNVDSINFVSTTGKKLTEVSGDPLEMSYLFQRLSVAIQTRRGNEVSFAGALSNFDC